jgi:3-hydroxyacyl-CoA dehydrogenase
MVRSEHAEGIALLTLEQPPVNGLNLATRRQLLQALNTSLGAVEVEAIVVWGGPRLFCAGADIEEFAQGLDGPAFTEPSLPSIIAALDAATKPVVAAIAGACLGGGLELALACHARLCDSSAKFGLPEVKLGLLPGAGGTQRLPRLIGIEPALKLILSGEIVAAAQAVELGLARWTAEDLRLAALRQARALIGQPLARISDLPARLADGISPASYFATQHALLRQKLPAPRACIDAVALTVDHTVAEGAPREFALFRELVGTVESRALRYGFFADRNAGCAPALPPGAQPPSIQRVGVVGTGTMGSGIAIACLDANLDTLVADASADALAAGRARIDAHFTAQVKKGRISAATAEQRLRQLHAVAGYEGLADCDLVIEAVFEDLELKCRVFRELDRVLPAGVLLASNTSTLDLDQIAAATGRPADVIGLHFFSPANVMRLLEVVRGGQTSPAALAAALRFAKRTGKIGVVAGVCDGFIGNRMFEEYLRQAYALVDEGLLPWRIDTVLEHWGMAMGPFAVMDLAGNDIGFAIRQRRMRAYPERPYSSFPDRIYELKRFGRKSGAGFYAYDATGKRSADALVTALAIEHARALARIRVSITDEEIIERCVLALVNEGARLLAEGIAERGSDLDVVYRHGYGFPAHRGGPLYFADELGLEHVLQSMRTFAAGYQGSAWEPAPLLLDTLRHGARLTDYQRRTS